MFDEDRIGDLLIAWTAARREGRELSVEELCAECPDLAEEVAARIRSLNAMDWLLEEDSDTANEWPSLPTLDELARRAEDESPLPETSLTIEQFGEAVVASGLKTEVDVAALRSASGDGSAGGFAAGLIAANRLTRYQACVLLAQTDEPLLLDQYEVQGRLGSGGMGVVYRARHRTMDRVVALKMLPAEVVDSEDKLRRFMREVKASAKLQHPNIVTTHDAREACGRHFLVMEYVEGKNLSEVVALHGPLSVGKAVEFVLQAARGLEHAHGQQVIHRDIKPANLILERRGTVKVLDMGLARMESRHPDSGAATVTELTEAGSVMGTISYMAPEQAVDAQTADHRSDVYSLGCTLYFLLAGEPPYAENSLVKIALAHQQQPIPALADVRDDVPAGLDRAFRRMMAKKPEDRFQSVAELIEALESLGIRDEAPPLSLERPVKANLAAETLSPGTTSRVLTADGAGSVTASSQRTGKRALILGGFVAASVLLGGYLLYLGRPGGEGRPDEQVTTGPPEDVVEADNVSTEQARNGWPEDAPRPAIAPFDAEQARRHRQAWADYLGVPVIQEVEVSGGATMALSLIPPGEFVMGSSEEEQARFVETSRIDQDSFGDYRILHEGPRHRVQITRPFYLGTCEVTQAQWEAVTGNNPVQVTHPSRPVTSVSWDDAQGFLAKLNEVFQEHQLTAALPTEAQWEYACRAGSQTAWYFADSADLLGEHAWFRSNSGEQTQPVAQLECNAFGLYDMAGNVLEWCADWYDEHYDTNAPSRDPGGPTTGTRRVIRGGSWLSMAYACRSAQRHNFEPDKPLWSIGFRVAASIDSDDASDPANNVADEIEAAATPDYALVFDGDADYVLLPSLVYDGSHPITVEASLRPTSVPDSPQGGVVIANISFPRMESGFQLTYATRENWVFGRQVGAEYRYKAAPASLNETVHLAGVFDGDNINLFVDGTLVLGEQKQLLQEPEGDEIRPFLIGGSWRRNGEVVKVVNTAFAGTIDNVRISSIARYGADFEPPQAMQPDDDTLALYLFDEGDGDVLVDSSGHGHHGQIHGATWVFADGSPIPERRD